jgi:hypothetical protein
MIRKLFIVILLGGALLSGCATQSIQEGKDISSSGIAYTDAVDNLLDVTAERLIDFDTAELKRTRRSLNLHEMIVDKNQALLSVLEELDRFRAQTKLLKTYFINLQALADSPVQDDAGGAVKSLSDSISKFNKDLEGKDGKESLTEEQKIQIGTLSGLVAHTIHGTRVKRALERDAEIIGINLAFQENQIANLAAILEDRFQTDNDLFLIEKVISPYVNKDMPLSESWDDDRKEWLKTQFVSQQWDTAKEAAKHLRGIWSEILEGKTDLNSLSVLISDVNEFVTTVQALKVAKETK